MAKLTFCKTQKEAVEVSDKLEKEAHKLVELAKKTPGAQVLCQGGGTMAGGTYGFQVGWVTDAERTRFLVKQVKSLNKQELEIFLAEIKNLK